jgi:PiT family inorganic phosphate transporter
MADFSLYLFLTIIILAIGFGIVNGFNDAANAIAPAIGSRAISPSHALAIAVVANMAGAATGTLVAQTIGKGILIPEAITYQVIIASLASIIIWGIWATRLGLPISLHHGFIAALASAGLAIEGGKAVVWGVMRSILASVGIAPLLGFAGGFIVMLAMHWIFRRSRPDTIRQVFGRLQLLTTAFMAYSHGKNDGQMPIGIITMALVIFYKDASIWDRLSLFDGGTWWVIVASALAISVGTALGGQRVIKTVGMRMTSLKPHQGFATQAAAATVVEIASSIGMPVSTTHCVSASVMGVGSTGRLSAVRWGVANRIVIAWILTFPICGVLGYLFALISHVKF